MLDDNRRSFAATLVIPTRGDDLHGGLCLRSWQLHEVSATLPRVCRSSGEQLGFKHIGQNFSNSTKDD